MRKIFFLAAFVLVGCSTVKSAMSPYSLVPEKPDEAWAGPTRSMKEVEVELPDQELLEKQGTYTLAELINVALHYNPDTQITWSEARASSAQYGESLQKYFPSADFVGLVERSKTANFLNTSGVLGVSDGQIVWNNVEQVNLGLTYTIFDFGQTRATSLAALNTLYNAQWQHNREIQTVIKLIMSDYYNYLYQKI